MAEIETYSDKENYTTVFDLRLKLISRSPLWLGSNIVAFHPGEPSLIADIILTYALFLIVKVIAIILISFIIYRHICLYYFESIMIVIEVYTSAVRS